MLMNRTVAFLDILAFKTILDQFPLEHIGASYQRAVEAASNILRDDFGRDQALYDHQPVIHIFSDSIIIYSKDDTENSCYAVIRYAHRILQNLIQHQFPVRGAIAYGQTWISEPIRIGDPFVTTYTLEQKQEWLGVVIDETVFTKFPEIRKFDNETYPEIVKYGVPLIKNKTDTSRDVDFEKMYCLNWLSKSNIDINPLEEMLTYLGPRFNQKFQHTVAFTEFIYEKYKLERWEKSKGKIQEDLPISETW